MRRGLPVERYSAAQVFERDGWMCMLCLEPIDRGASWPASRSASIDHIVPISLGGHDVWGNVQSAHLGCNSRKSNKVAV